MASPRVDRRRAPGSSAPAKGSVAVGLFCVLLSFILITCAESSAELREGRLGTAEEGMATYYARRLAGHRTANGERYDPAGFTAAHPVLPFGTRVRVTRMEHGSRSVVVRINDRCAGGKKIIDLSEAAARRLGMMTAGIVRVRIEVVSGHAN